MKKILLIAAACLLGPAHAWAQQSAAPRTVEEKLSYAIALEVARRFVEQGMLVDEGMALRGIQDGMRGTPLLADDEIRRLLNSLQSQARQRNALDRRTAALKNQRDSEAALAANAKAPGVQTLPDGVQYRVVKSGRSAMAGAQSFSSAASSVGDANAPLLLSFTGRLMNGREVARVGADKPVAVDAGSLIAGLREAAVRMPVGARWKVWVPPELAYGPAGNGDLIGPNETLVFDIERHADERS